MSTTRSLFANHDNPTYHICHAAHAASTKQCAHFFNLVCDYQDNRIIQGSCGQLFIGNSTVMLQIVIDLSYDSFINKPDTYRIM